MIKAIRVSIILVCATLLGGCGYSISRESDPVIHDTATSSNSIFGINPFGSPQSVNTFATTASRRIVIVKEKNYLDEQSEKNNDSFVTCAEPSPDVGEAFASAIADGIKLAVQAEGSPITGEIANQYARSVATQIAPLLYRTQGLQLFRDARYNLCIERMNKWWDGDNKPFHAETRYIFDKSLELIKQELPHMEAAQKAFANIKLGSPLDIDAVVKLLNATKPQPSEETTTKK